MSKETFCILKETYSIRKRDLFCQKRDPLTLAVFFQDAQITLERKHVYSLMRASINAEDLQVEYISINIYLYIYIYIYIYIYLYIYIYIYIYIDIYL